MQPIQVLQIVMLILAAFQVHLLLRDKEKRNRKEAEMKAKMKKRGKEALLTLSAHSDGSALLIHPYDECFFERYGTRIPEWVRAYDRDISRILFMQQKQEKEMTREETKKAIEVMQAYVDGKDIEYRARTNERENWNSWSFYRECNTSWNWNYNEYRIYKSDKEKAKAFFDWRGKNIQWVRPKQVCNIVYKTIALGFDGFTIMDGITTVDGICNFITWKQAGEKYEWSSDNATWRKFE